jgi:RimJ/RimL family protein N-acetyltransferase
VIARAFEVLRVDRLFAGHHPNNTASQKTLLRLGFVYTRHELYAPTGVQHPSFGLVAR